MAQVVPLFPDDSTGSADHSRPSLFELLAEEQLRDVLHPVVRYVLSYLAQRYPRYFLRVLNHHEEVFAGLLLLVERHHLKKHSKLILADPIAVPGYPQLIQSDASLSEHFYQLRIEPTSTIPTPRLDAIDPPKPRSLSRRQRWGMLLFLVGLPYLRARAQDYYERLGGGRDAESEGAEPEIHAVTIKQRLFKRLYPYVSLVFDVTLLGFDIAYMFGRSKDYRPWHRLLGVGVRRRGQEDDSPLPQGILANLPPVLPPLLLLLKLSQWWYSPTSPRTLNTASSSTSTSSRAKVHANILPPRPLPILPQFLPLTPLDSPILSTQDALANETNANMGMVEADNHRGQKGYQITEEEFGTCPLCRKRWQNPAVLPSGWVVCWRCGWEAVEGEEEDNGEEEEGDAEIKTSGTEEQADIEGDPGHVEMEKKVKMPKRKGRCPITGVPVGPGQLRRVLV